MGDTAVEGREADDSSVSLRHQVELLKRELDEAVQQQTATSEILRVIPISTSSAQPVFDAIAKSVARLCEAEFCFVFQFDGEFLHPVAYHGISREGIEAVRARFPQRPS